MVKTKHKIPKPSRDWTIWMLLRIFGLSVNTRMTARLRGMRNDPETPSLVPCPPKANVVLQPGHEVESREAKLRKLGVPCWK